MARRRGVFIGDLAVGYFADFCLAMAAASLFAGGLAQRTKANRETPRWVHVPDSFSDQLAEPYGVRWSSFQTHQLASCGAARILGLHSDGFAILRHPHSHFHRRVVLVALPGTPPNAKTGAFGRLVLF